MGFSHDHSHQSSSLLPKKFIPCVFYVFIPLAILHYYLFPLSPTQIQPTTVSSSLPPPPQGKDRAEIESGTPATPVRCDYSDGEWVQTKTEPLYTGLSCGTIKTGQNCMANGRPDSGYLYWRWKPKQCDLPFFDPVSFLQLITNRHVAFVGDSMARNQLESLMCLLATASPPELVYRDSEENKFRRWVFHQYNATVSVFWSPFLVKGVEKAESAGIQHNILYLDKANERWATELDRIDMVVFSIGHWFLHRAKFYEGDSLIGCFGLTELNCTQLNFFEAFQRVIHTTLNEANKRFLASDKAVVITTFTSGHFEGDWDKLGACSKIEPFKEGEQEMPYLEMDMRRREVQEVEMAMKEVREKGGRLKIEALDVTKLALMRPDGHPGPYMHPNPFRDGVKDRVPNDCVHWCMPGPVDTWNGILLQMMKRWKLE